MKQGATASVVYIHASKVCFGWQVLLDVGDGGRIRCRFKGGV